MAAIILAGIIAVGIIAFIMMYNGLIRLRNKVDEAYATLDAHLKKRYDLIPNLVEIVKGYASHERDTLEAVISARNKALGADMAGIGKREYFEIDESERGNVSISFS
jgi:LemA protein